MVLGALKAARRSRQWAISSSGVAVSLSTTAAATTGPDEQPYAGGPIQLVDGDTGKIRLCNDYDEPGQRCRVWAHVERHASPPKKKATVRGGLTTMAAIQPAPAPAVAETEKKGKSQ